MKVTPRYPADTDAARYCSQCEQWLPFSRFHKTKEPRVTRGFAYSRWCRSCLKAAKGYPAMVPVQKIAPTVKVMIEQVGFSDAARRIGVTHATLSYWLHNALTVHGKPAKRVRQINVVKVLRARDKLNKEIAAGATFELRADTQQRSRKRNGRCTGCGCDFETYTDGCGSCWDRRRSRARRAA